METKLKRTKIQSHYQWRWRCISMSAAPSSEEIFLCIRDASIAGNLAFAAAAIPKQRLRKVASSTRINHERT